MSRKDARKAISPLRLHSKKFDKPTSTETILEDGAIKFVLSGWASTSEKDYDGDIILPEGINVDRYNQNPVVKRGHLRGVENNIGTAEVTVKQEDGVNGLRIVAEVILNPSIESHKEIIHGIRHGLINGWSIGFAKVVVAYDEEKKAKVIKSCELHEVSLVDIPNNPLTVRKFVEIASEKQFDEEGNEIIEDLSDDDNNEDNIEGGVEEDIEFVVEPGSDNPSFDDSDNDTSGESEVKMVGGSYKAVSLDSLAVGMMVRYMKTYQMTDWRDGTTYTWDYVNNAEIVKITSEVDENGNVEQEVYLLEYELAMDGREPTTNLNKYDANEIVMIELSEEQLKSFKGEVVNKDVTESVTDGEVSEVSDNSEGEGDDKVGNDGGTNGDNAETVDGNDTAVVVDEPEQKEGEQDNQENLGEGEGEGENAGNKDLISEELTKSIELKDLRIKELETELESKEAELKEAGELGTKALEVIEKQSAKIEELEKVVEKATGNYKELARVYELNEKKSVEEVKNQPGDALRRKLGTI